MLHLQGIEMTNHSCLSAGILSKVWMNIRAEDNRERWGSEQELCNNTGWADSSTFAPLLNSAFTVPHKGALHWPASTLFVLSKGSRIHGEDGQWGIYYGPAEVLALTSTLLLNCVCGATFEPSFDVGFLPDLWLLVKGVVLRDVWNDLNSAAEISRSKSRDVIYKCLYFEYFLLYWFHIDFKHIRERTGFRCVFMQHMSEWGVNLRWDIEVPLKNAIIRRIKLW